MRRLEELATTDGLTGCFNKRSFHEQLKAKLSAAERFGRKLSLIITDIDHFKIVNDTYGHATGDVVIRELGAILDRLKRETDIVARFGGEEFCLLCEETDADGAARLAERVREELEAPRFETELGKLKVTCSLGVATYPEHARDARRPVRGGRSGALQGQARRPESSRERLERRTDALGSGSPTAPAHPGVRFVHTKLGERRF